MKCYKYKNYRKLILIIIVLSLCACGVEKKYTDPNIVDIELTNRALVVQAFTQDNPGYDTEGNVLVSGIYLSWRAFPKDFDENNNLCTDFTIYENGEAIYTGIHDTNLYIKDGSKESVYSVKASSDQEESSSVHPLMNHYKEYQLYCPEKQTMPDGTQTSYSANDMSIGDVNGDGKEELIVKWMPDNEKDNSEAGYTGTTILDTYVIDDDSRKVALLSRIDLGVNIRSGDHYTQFLVWDFNGDGKDELAVKTAPGTTVYSSKDGTDTSLQKNDIIGKTQSQYDYRNTDGYILKGDEYFTVFDIEKGIEIDSVDYEPGRGNVEKWGDEYGNRVDRYLAGVAYLDGKHPSAIMGRGYYTRTALTAYGMKDTNNDGIGDSLSIIWKYDTESHDGPVGQGGHNLAIGDVDQDGKDEILYCSSAYDHDGTLMYSTGLGHGDVTILGDLIPWNDGLEVFAVHEEKNMKYQVEIHDACTGKILLGYAVKDTDVGRGLAADIDLSKEGVEFWASKGINSTGKGLWNSTDADVISTQNEELTILSKGSSPSKDIPIYWDGDLAQELLDHTYNEKQHDCRSVYISKWNTEKKTSDVLFTSQEISSSNRTKGNVGLTVDLFGDWREEFIVRCVDNPNNIRIYTTPYLTDYSFPSLLTDKMYRKGIARENVGYNIHGYGETFLSQRK